MSSLSQRIICLTFILWLISTSVYSPFILGSKWKTLSFLVNTSVFSDNQETYLFQKERGGVRRTTSSSGRNISKAILGDRAFDNNAA